MSISKGCVPADLQEALADALALQCGTGGIDIVTAILTLAACVNELTVAVREIDGTLVNHPSNQG